LGISSKILGEMSESPFADAVEQRRFRVLVVDDEPSIRRLLRAFFEQHSYEVDTADGGEKALELVRRHAYDLVLLDMKMPDLDGLTTLREIKKIDANSSVLMMTAYGTIHTAVDAMKSGAEDFLIKPLSIEALGIQIERIREYRSLKEECLMLRERVAGSAEEFNLVSRNKRMQEILSLIAKVAPLPSTVLIQGESGTGKELIARAIHCQGPRRSRRFVAINCGVIPVHLLESELFGYERGAFTGAESRKIGYFEAAEGGTIFLDEISEMSVDLQVKLLRVIQERSFQRVGGTEEIHTDARILASTNRNLEDEVAQNRFRKDLYYRINVIRIEVPPLRERKEDVSLLAYHFLRKYATAFGKTVTGISAPAMEALIRNPWAGNVRELENVVERAVVVAEGGEITLRDLPAELRQAQASPEALGAIKPFRIAKNDFEIAYLKRALNEVEGNIALAARLTGIPRQNLYEKLKKNDIHWERFRPQLDRDAAFL
jgi:two-component system response regulator HydG